MDIFQKLKCLANLARTLQRNSLRKKLPPEAYTLHTFINKRSVCFDIGGGQGRFTLIMSRLASSGKVFTFEPNRYNFTVLSYIKKLYMLENVILAKKALSDRKGRSTLFIPIKENNRIGYDLTHLGFSTHIGETKGYFEKERIEMTTLDSFCKEMDVRVIDFIKCDVEGAELLVFKGGKKMISTHLPGVLCEIVPVHLKRFGCYPRELIDFFRSRGYQMFVLEEGKFIPVDRVTENNVDYFFLHPEKYIPGV